MTVERRYSRRFPVDFGVKFRYRDCCPCTSQALDLSLEGMQLATDCSSPPTGGFVEIQFSLGGRLWKIPAVVTHSASGRIGVMFREAQPRLYQTLRPSSEAGFFSAPASRATH